MTLSYHATKRSFSLPLGFRTHWRVNASLLALEILSCRANRISCKVVWKITFVDAVCTLQLENVTVPNLVSSSRFQFIKRIVFLLWPDGAVAVYFWSTDARTDEDSKGWCGLYFCSSPFSTRPWGERPTLTDIWLGNVWLMKWQSVFLRCECKFPLYLTFVL